jgi:hypothetical protein
MLTKNEKNFWKRIVRKVHNEKFLSIIYIIKPDKDVRTYTVVGYKNIHGRMDRSICEIAPETYRKYKKLFL